MTEDELANLFASHVVERRKRFETGGRLVHYTNAEAAYKIIKSRRIWLRNASMMNDFSEIQHGLHCLTNAWASEAGLKLQAMLNRIKDGLHNELATLFDGHTDAMKLGTFIISLSEHDDDEDELGRLSMWRAYGARAGVALVLNNTTFAAVTDAMKVYSAPVFYHSVAQFEAWFAGWADGLLAAEAQLGEVDPVSIQTWMFYALRSFALCTKHPGFAEEREWRVFYSTTFEGETEWVTPEVETIGGVPQLVMKLSLHDNTDKGVTGVAPATLFNRVIIGPCEHPLQVRASIAMALADAGIEEPLAHMWMSYIPLRQN